ncbi:YheC/YheD family protein [Polycladomyces sp. WAk]|uniref:YheC/YheD family protein n=1 Tax=Polycladomyces zharkentensis TaxID=2807616 RepID=A0ABS2WMU4_9BACL|nr:YheC/YheD family protein [Polycladomyces sp. WAk]MBN2910878.1 YheC/YheD family protein [Polycladomyces sp. WAk]
MKPAGWDPERRFLNKWGMHLLLSEQRDAPCHLPETHLLDETTLHRLLQRYERVYIKPVAGFGGSRISLVEQQASQIHWTRQETGQQLMFPDWLRFWPVFSSSHPKSDNYIAQQAAPLHTYQNRPFDVRVHLQRDTDNHWVYAGDLVRVAGSGGIVSNVGITGGEVIPTERVLQALGLAETTHHSWRAIADWVCRSLDTVHRFAEVGLDLGVDGNGQWWLLEVNTNDAWGGPSHELFAQLPDTKQYQEIRRRYARRVGVPQWLQDIVFGQSDSDGGTD